MNVWTAVDPGPARDTPFLTVHATCQIVPGQGRDMKTAVRRNVGVPVCVGIAGTKTLAKLANKWAKNNPAFDGVCHWDSVPAADRESLMRRLSVIEIWGVATRLTKRLNALGIQSILDLSRADPVMIRDRFSVVMMRTVLELQGTPCIPMEEERIGRD
jgi:DNA polymerase V